MKKCAKCGAFIDDTKLYCEECEKAFETGGRARMNEVDTSLTKWQFFYRYVSYRTKRKVTQTFIFGLILGGINLIACIIAAAMSYGWWTMLDVILIIGASIWFYKRPGFLAAGLFLGYAAINVVVAIVETGSITGWLLVVAGIVMVRVANKVDKEYKLYLSGKDWF